MGPAPTPKPIWGPSRTPQQSASAIDSVPRHTATTSEYVSAAVAVLFWPLVFFGANLSPYGAPSSQSFLA